MLNKKMVDDEAEFSETTRSAPQRFKSLDWK